jgi:hypothetical protein
MAEQATTVAHESAPPPRIRFRNLVWVALALLVLIGAIGLDEPWLLNFVHVLAGLLWTGIDLFMGFVIGPILRQLDLAARRAVITRLMPRMLFLMPTLATVTTTAGWFLAEQGGYLELGLPQLWWVIAALAVVTVLTLQGFGILLPINIKVFLQMRKESPDLARVGRWMRVYLWVIASQGVMQVAIIVIMARFVTGL